ncbi:MAG TPA: cytochrome c [Geminicoccus sp.]|nr:cytochrome c [Geminicoccus sp.]
MLARVTSIALGLALAGLVGAAGAQDMVAKRQEEMKGFGKNMGIVKGAVVDKKSTLADAAAAAAHIAGDAPEIPSWFPAGSTQGETAALPVIWEKPDEFAAKAKNMGELAAKLEAAAKSGDQAAAMAAFAALGRDGCGGCHSTFRKPQS